MPTDNLGTYAPLPLCLCGHVRSAHNFYEDHVECMDCETCDTYVYSGVGISREITR